MRPTSARRLSPEARWRLLRTVARSRPPVAGRAQGTGAGAGGEWLPVPSPPASAVSGAAVRAAGGGSAAMGPAEVGGSMTGTERWPMRRAGRENLLRAVSPVMPSQRRADLVPRSPALQHVDHTEGRGNFGP